MQQHQLPPLSHKQLGRAKQAACAGYAHPHRQRCNIFQLLTKRITLSFPSIILRSNVTRLEGRLNLAVSHATNRDRVHQDQPLAQFLTLSRQATVGCKCLSYLMR